MRILEERIGEWIAAAERSGELRRAPSWGRPLPPDGYFETPAELRLGYKVLRNADVLPPEVELLRERGELRERLAATIGEPERAAIRRRLVEVERRAAVMLERRRRRG